MNEKQMLANKIVNYSLKVKKSDKVLISYESPVCNDLVKEIIKETYRAGAVPFVKEIDKEVSVTLSEGLTMERIEILKEIFLFENNIYDCFVNIKYYDNDFELKNIDHEMMNRYYESIKDYRNERTNHKRWVLLNFPTKLEAYKAKMKTQEYYDFSFDTMNLDYMKMQSKIEPLKKLMEKTDKVRITGKNTDITFSIKDIPVIPCLGEMNLPDGEIFTAPVKDSVNGIITYNVPAPHDGNIFNNICLEFKNGRIVNAKCDSDNEALNKIFDIDEGARYVGEFSFGLNPKIKHPIGNILFDEKIIGSIHFTPGSAYEEADNGNKSNLHWDLVLIQRDEYGGGDIYFDDILIRHNGEFVLDELKDLNS